MTRTCEHWGLSPFPFELPGWVVERGLWATVDGKGVIRPGSPSFLSWRFAVNPLSRYVTATGTQGTVEGDLLLMFLKTYWEDNVVTPTGWTLLRMDDTGFGGSPGLGAQRAFIYWKYASAEDAFRARTAAPTWVVDTTDNNKNTIEVLTYRGMSIVGHSGFHTHFEDAGGLLPLTAPSVGGAGTTLVSTFGWGLASDNYGGDLPAAPSGMTRLGSGGDFGYVMTSTWRKSVSGAGLAETGVPSSYFYGTAQSVLLTKANTAGGVARYPVGAGSIDLSVDVTHTGSGTSSIFLAYDPATDAGLFLNYNSDGTISLTQRAAGVPTMLATATVAAFTTANFDINYDATHGTVVVRLDGTVIISVDLTIAPVTFADAFTRADSASGGVGNGWTYFGLDYGQNVYSGTSKPGDWKITSNAAQVPVYTYLGTLVEGKYKCIGQEVGSNDFDISVVPATDWYRGAGGGRGFAVRRSSIDGSFVFVNASGIYFIGQGFETAFDGSMDVQSLAGDTVRLVGSGSQLTYYVNGTQQWSVTVNLNVSSSCTMHGLGSSSPFDGIYGPHGVDSFTMHAAPNPTLTGSWAGLAGDRAGADQWDNFCWGPLPLLLALAAANDNDSNQYERSVNGGLTFVYTPIGLRRAFCGLANDTVTIVGGLQQVVQSDPASSFPLATSSDAGLTWTPRQVPMQDVLSLADNGTMYVAGGAMTSTAPNYCISTSPDGINWTGRSSPFDGTGDEVYGILRATGGVFIAIAPFAPLHVATSVDNGTTWSALKTLPAVTAGRSRNGTLGFTQAIATSCVYVVERETSTGDKYAGVLLSTDQGETWSSVPITLDGANATGTVQAVTYVPRLSLFVLALQDDSGIYHAATSTDGVAFTSRSTGIRPASVGYDSEYVYLGGSQGTAKRFSRSADGLHWTDLSVPAPRVTRLVNYAPRRTGPTLRVGGGLSNVLFHPRPTGGGVA